MAYCILNSNNKVLRYIPDVIRHADLNTKSLGFLPNSAYYEQALQGKLWIVVDRSTHSYVGHLLFGTNFPLMRIVQLYIHDDHRGGGLAKINK